MSNFKFRPIIAILFGVLNVLLCPLIIADNPSGAELSFYPTPPPINGTENILLWFKSTDHSNIKEWVSKLSNLLAAYKDTSLTPGRMENIVNCSFAHAPPKGKVCHVEAISFRPCSEEKNFNYHTGTPCIFLKMNTAENWTPEFFNNSKELPENMPTELKNYIADVERMDKNRLNTVWLTCKGSNPVDEENIGPLQYSDRGFPGYFFLNGRPEGYLSPLIAISFERPMKSLIISVECKLWARNIVHDSKTKSGLVEFELLID